MQFSVKFIGGPRNGKRDRDCPDFHTGQPFVVRESGGVYLLVTTKQCGFPVRYAWIADGDTRPPEISDEEKCEAWPHAPPDVEL